jgi:hypothetical protein
LNKYHNRKIVVDGIQFDSKAEAARYLELKNLPVIKDLELQKKFEIIPKQKGERAATYIVDFYYYDTTKGWYVAEDVKGFSTDVYILKRKLFKQRYPHIEFIEVKR